jgi:sugar lactone lactonase YvrE
MSDEPEVRILAQGLAFPEGPRWRDGALWFSDIRGQTVQVLNPDGRRRDVVRLNDSPSGLGFLPDGTPIVVSMRDRLLLRLVAGKAELHADLRDVAGDFLNDMLVDEQGRAYVGSRSASLRPQAGPLGVDSALDAIVIVEPDGDVRLGATGAISPNGTVLTPDGCTLIVAETYAQQLVAYDRSPAGGLTNRRIFAVVPGRYPDGICLDEEGAVWAGSPYTHEFVRIRAGGEVTDRIAMPGGVACALGGDDGRSLFLLGVDPMSLPVVDGGKVGAQTTAEPAALTSGRIGVTQVRWAAARMP